MKLLNYLFRNSPYIVILVIVTSFLSGLSNASLITLINQALGGPAKLTELGWQFAGLALFSLVTAVVSQLMLTYLYRKAVFDWQVHLGQEILKAPLRQLEAVGNPALLAVLTHDVPTIGSSLLPMLPLCTNVVVVVVCLGYMCWLSWQLFLGTMILLLAGGIAQKMCLKRGEILLMSARDKADDLQGYFHMMTDGMKELKLHHRRRRDFFEKNLKPTATVIQRLSFTWSTFYLIGETWTRFLLLFIIGVILFVFPSFMQLNSQILTGYILILLYIRSMLMSIMGAIPAMAEANVAFLKIQGLGLKLMANAADARLPDCAESIRHWRSLELSDITHTYYREREDGDFILGPINMRFQPGELIFLVGGNGSGKTTLAKLITGLYIPEAGEIWLDGNRITDASREEYRQLFSVVFSDFQLFNDLLGLEMSDFDEQAQKYLVKLQLDHKVKVENGRLSTTALSRGQRQRLALLTAYLEDRPFYIFDEWASNQDPIFKDVFYTQFLPELKAQGKTILVISHDDKYFHLGDRVLKLDYGQLVEQIPYTLSSNVPSGA